MHAYVGQSVGRYRGSDLVRGRTAFAEDRQPQAGLVLKVFRSNRPHAEMSGLDTSEAVKVPGVVGILTAADIPGVNRYGVIIKDQPLLAEHKVRFVGEAIALIAAETESAAEEALQTIEVQFQDLPPVFDCEKALLPEAGMVHEQGNLLRRNTVRKGDAAQEFQNSDFVLEHTVSTQRGEHAYLEPDAGSGFIDAEGHFVIQACTQNPHYDQKDVAALLGLDREQVHIVQTATGGGFGSKLDLTVQGFIGLALYHFQRPVSLVYSREEAFLATSKRHPSKIHLKAGVSKEGKLQALQARLLFDSGPYASYGVPLTLRAAIQVTGPYDIPNVDVESVSVYTNNSISGAMRGVAIVQTSFASESLMDMLAHKAGLDPLEFRKINAMQPGCRTATGQQLEHSVGILETLKALDSEYAKALAWKEVGKSGSVKRGIGLGAMWYGIGAMAAANPAHATMRVDAGGRMSLCTGAADIGQGSNTIFCQIARENLGVDPGLIRIIAGDTAQTLDAGATSSSRQTYVSGNAVLDASRKMAAALLQDAASVLGRSQDELLLKDSQVMDSRGERLMPIVELVEALVQKQGPMQWEGYFDPATTELDPETGQGIPFGTYAFASHLVRLEVDTETGRVRVDKVVAAHDVGTAINPQSIMGQIHGGVGMGLGFALMEEFLPGQTLSLSEYHIPTSLDLPRIQGIIVEDPEPTGPFGAKGMGEPSLAPTPPAIVNAIADALESRIDRLPADPETVRKAVLRTKP